MVTTEQLLDWVRAHPLPDKRIIPVCLWGERGVGKTQWVSGYCQQRNLGFRGYQPAHDTTGSDIVGQAHIDESTDRTVYARPMWLPSEDDPIVYEERGVLFVDELNRAPKAVIRGLMEPLGEGTIGHSAWTLPEQWCFVCAANPPESGYDVDTLDDSLMNKILHLPMGFDVVRWSAWAGESAIDSDLITFTAQYTDLIADASTELPDTVKQQIRATPRTVEYLARLYEKGMDKDLLLVLAQGLIGDTPAQQLLLHIDSQEKPVSAEEVLGDPDFASRLIAHVAEGRDDLLDASLTLILAMMVRYKPSQEAAARVAIFLRAIGEARAKVAWERVSLEAPLWTAPILKELKNS